MGQHEMTRPRPQRDGQRPGWAKWLVIVLAGGVALVAALAVPAVALTERPQFCPTCHEMQPYYTAFEAGVHKGIGCTDCHVGGGVAARVSHKALALREVYAHFTSKPTFPKGQASVPDSRCTACHKDLRAGAGGFDHATHSASMRCTQCHRDVGHTVTPQALAAAGVLSKAAKLQAATTAVRVASAETSPAYTPPPERTTYHKHMKCTRCHDLTEFQCSKCHKPPHAPRGECVTCHRADPRPAPWKFAHPLSTTCTDCHTAPDGHAGRGTDCARCHAAGKDWSFTHPDAKADCTSCHAKPTTGTHAYRIKCAGCHTRTVKFASTTHVHTRGDACLDCHETPSRKHSVWPCRTCHAVGTSWAFKHPVRTDCGTCHRAPRSHYGTTCSACHKVGVPFPDAKVDHRYVGTRCAGCHTAPSGHAGRGADCYACHRQAGKSWAFTHSTGIQCASCHKGPRGHFTSGCQRCHSPSRSWSAARYTHPSTGMSIGSMACADCHPNGLATHTCARCHNGTPGD